MSLNVHIKHAGKIYDLQLDTDRPPTVFKDAIYQITGVPPDRMKVMIKGGILKDDHDWKKVAPKEGQTFMVVGAAGELPKPPPKPIVFLEDMEDSEIAEALAIPGGMKNLGNTCYMAATLQALRAVPELQASLNTYRPAPPGGSSSLGPGNSQLTVALRDLYSEMGRSTDSVVPIAFLQVLRQVVPQFGETQPGPMGASYAQQDAEECWVQLTNALNILPGLPASSSASISPADGTEAAASTSTSSVADNTFVKQYMTARMRRELKCDESSDEPASVTEESVLKVSCNISITTNYMHAGIADSLNSKIEKISQTLGREAVYSQTERLSRLPTYLTVHMVRFAWKRDINKKAKIMRRVKFPTEFDVLDLVTDDLKAKILPVNTKLKTVDKDRFERAKVRKRTKLAAAAALKAEKEKKDGDVEMADATATQAASSSSGVETGSAMAGEEKETVAGAALEDESVYRAKELKELEGLIHPDLKADTGCSVSGLYDLVAIVTHKGAAADSGHYIGFVKKSVFHGQKSSSGSIPTGAEAEDEDWYKFDDEKVSIFPKEKLETLAGGGEDSSAYVLLYRSKSLA